MAMDIAMITGVTMASSTSASVLSCTSFITQRQPASGRSDILTSIMWLKLSVRLPPGPCGYRTISSPPSRLKDVPPARIPGEGGEQLDDLPADAETIRASLLDAFDRQRQVDLAARLVARHLTLGHSPQALIATLARALLREDAGFHAYQMLEAGVRQFAAWGASDEGR